MEHISWGQLSISVTDPTKALKAAIQIKTCMMCVDRSDIRMAIGIGVKSDNTKKITEQNGPAYIRSGHLPDKIKKGWL